MPFCKHGYIPPNIGVCAVCAEPIAHQGSIPRSSLPALPAGLHPPFTVTGNIIGDKYGMVLQTYRATEATFLAALLNAVYPAKSP